MAEPSSNGAPRASFRDPGTDFLKEKTVLVTGATGSFGQCFVRRLLRTGAQKIIVFSRDELKQHHMQQSLTDPDGRVRFFLGDIRDRDRLRRAFHGVHLIVHAAALKQVPTLEYNPFEAVQTNIIGGQNIIDAALDSGVERVVALSTDKAANPVNLYGATKLCLEKLFVAGNSYGGAKGTRFSVVRYGNVVGSRGSIVPLFLEKRKHGVLPVTDRRMTRFWLTLEMGVDLVLTALSTMHGGEIYVPKVASLPILDVARALGPDCEVRLIGTRPGEKIHEVLITEHEAPHAIDAGDFFVIAPQFPWWDAETWRQSAKLPHGFVYTSETSERLTAAEFLAMVEAA